MKFQSNSSNVGPDMVQASSGGGGGFIDRVGKLFGGVAGHRNAMDLIEHRAKWDAAGKMAITTHNVDETHRGFVKANDEAVDSTIRSSITLDNSRYDDGKRITRRADPGQEPVSGQDHTPISGVSREGVQLQKTGQRPTKGEKINYADKDTNKGPGTVNDLTVGDTCGVGATGGVKSNKKFAIPNPSRSKGNKNGNKRRSNVNFGGKK